MRTIKSIAVLAALMLVGGMFTIQAQTFNRRTFVRFSQPVEVPGKVLPAGKYTFQLADTSTNVVQIYNEEASQLITTVLAIRIFRLTRTDRTVIEFAERPAGAPLALRAWFYPGDNYGQGFVYPKS